MKIIAKNKKAFFDYEIEKKYEAGIVLKGSEIKSIREGNVNLKDSFAKINYKNEIILSNMHIAIYKNIHTIEKLDERASRKLLMHKKEIMKIKSILMQQGYSLVPTMIYFKNNFVKIEIGLARGKKKYDKRNDLKEKDLKREIQKINKNKY